jgi:hypothetical protein
MPLLDVIRNITYSNTNADSYTHMRQNGCVYDDMWNWRNGGVIGDMVLMERAINWALEELDLEGLQRPRAVLGDDGRSALKVIGVKPSQLVGGLDLEQVPLYNMEPFAGPEGHYDLGVSLYDMESGWKS